MRISCLGITWIVAAAFMQISTYTSPAACNASQFYNVLLLECGTCPINTVQADDIAYCNCSNSFYQNVSVIGFNSSSSCQPLNASYNNTSQVVSLYDIDGTYNPKVTTCGSSSYPDALNSICIPCGPGAIYSSTLSSCICTTTDNYYFNGFCYVNTNATWKQIKTNLTPSDFIVEQHGMVGCKQYGLIQSCNMLMNKCIMNGYGSDFFCQMLANLTVSKNPSSGLPVYTFSSQITSSINLYASSQIANTSTVKSTFYFVLVEFNADGSTNDIKPLDNSIFPCYMSAEDIVEFQSFKGIFKKECINIKTFGTQYFYDIYVQNGDGSFSEVPVQIGNNFYKRFTPSGYNMQLFLTSVPPLQVPYITLQPGSPPLQILTYASSSNKSINYLPFLAVFMAVMMVIFVLSFYRYLKYNPDENNDPYYCFKVIFLFFVNIIKYLAMGMHLWLLCFTTYLFCFYKFQQTIYLIIPDVGSDTTGLYQMFTALYYVNFSFMLVAVMIYLFNLTNTVDYFLIDWEKEKELGKFEIGKNKKEVSIWRKVLLVNQLYELSMNRIINIELVSLFSLLFLSGLSWIDLNSCIPSTSNFINDNAKYISPILSYFLITFVIFAIASLQFIIRHAIRIWFPLPIENFVDLCSVSNISIIIFDEALHGYYIHGMNPLGQSQGSLAYIQSMFDKQAKSFGKSRSFKLEDTDQCQTFEVVFPFEIRQAFQVKYKSRYNQKLAGKAYNTSIMTNPIPEMLSEEDYKDLQQINNSMLESFKYYLEGVKTSMMNVRDRSCLQKIINCPIDTATMGKLPVFFKDYWYEFSNVLLTGHEFMLLFNFINFVNVFYIATSNIYYSFFIAFIFEKLWMITFGFFIKRNISKNTLIDDKFFG